MDLAPKEKARQLSEKPPAVTGSEKPPAVTGSEKPPAVTAREAASVKRHRSTDGTNFYLVKRHHV